MRLTLSPPTTETIESADRTLTTLLSLPTRPPPFLDTSLPDGHRPSPSHRRRHPPRRPSDLCRPSLRLPLQRAHRTRTRTPSRRLSSPPSTRTRPKVVHHLRANTPSFSNPVKGSPSGSLVISADNTIPNNKFSVGLSVGGSPAFVMSAGPNLVHKFAPTPTYFIAAGSEIKVGTILDVTTVNPTQQVIFPDNVYSLSYALGTDNRWTII